MLITMTSADGTSAGIAADIVAAVVPASDKERPNTPIIGMAVLLFKIPTMVPQVIRGGIAETIEKVNAALRGEAEAPLHVADS